MTLNIRVGGQWRYGTVGRLPCFTVVKWLIAGILLLTTVLLWIAQVDYWWIVGSVSLLLSQALIIAYWPEAKFGTLPNLLLFVAVILGFARSTFIAQNHSVRDRIIAAVTPVQSTPLKSLPAPVRKWLNTSGALNHDPPSWVTIRQELKMKLSPEQQKWYTATAAQIVTLRNAVQITYRFQTSLLPPSCTVKNLT